MSDRMTDLHREEVIIGDVYEHPITKTVSEIEAVIYGALSFNVPSRYDHGDNQLCGIDMAAFAVIFMFSTGIDRMTYGLAPHDICIRDVRLIRAIQIGDTLRAESEVLEIKETAAAGAQDFELEIRAYNQRNEVVAKLRYLGMMRKPAPKLTLQ